MDKINDFDQYFVVWSDEKSRVYDPFTNLEDAYQHMVEKLSEGKWACVSSKDKLPKIHYTHIRR
tara:strand:+ start:936 stop:1127 length:192 start_codon:yes stop_codon:yes gene_type:complete